MGYAKGVAAGETVRHVRQNCPAFRKYPSPKSNHPKKAGLSSLRNTASKRKILRIVPIKTAYGQLAFLQK